MRPFYISQSSDDDDDKLWRFLRGNEADGVIVFNALFSLGSFLSQLWMHATKPPQFSSVLLSLLPPFRMIYYGTREFQIPRSLFLSPRRKKTKDR